MRVACDEILKRIVELHSQVDLAIIREELFPVEPSTPTNDVVKDSAEELEEGQVEPQQDNATS
ncbi:Hypothetical predicted protein [Olea europaea subsp. europaea]|uniref:Uncharacterized protein n=2 Tax=Olea europaea subsp. europaea TaxID=158383 RepID=A0A8S0U7N3_OLEEU|nr:Hypothetical predicted protein [Olea europaea subsp. europaea]